MHAKTTKKILILGFGRSRLTIFSSKVMKLKFDIHWSCCFRFHFRLKAQKFKSVSLLMIFNRSLSPGTVSRSYHCYCSFRFHFRWKAGKWFRSCFHLTQWALLTFYISPYAVSSSYCYCYEKVMIRKLFTFCSEQCSLSFVFCLLHLFVALTFQCSMLNAQCSILTLYSEQQWRPKWRQQELLRSRLNWSCYCFLLLLEPLLLSLLFLFRDWNHY